MKRNRVTRAPPSYPTRTRLLRRARNGVLVGLLAVATVPACVMYQDLDGLPAEPGEHWRAVLPADGLRTFYFEGGEGWVTYQLSLVVGRGELAVWLEDNDQVLLDQVEALFQDLPPERFEPEADRAELIQQIVALLVQAWADDGGDGEAEVTDFDFIVSEYVLGGDTGDTGDLP